MKLLKRLMALEQRVANLERQAALFLPTTPEPKEIPFKEWAAGEAQRESIGLSAIYNRVNRGHYPNLPVRRVNGRVMFVQVPNQ